MAQDWFDANQPESPQRGPGTSTTPPAPAPSPNGTPNYSGDWQNLYHFAPSANPTAADVNKAFMQFVGHGATDVTPWANDPNYAQNIYNSQEAQNYRQTHRPDGSTADGSTANQFSKTSTSADLLAALNTAKAAPGSAQATAITKQYTDALGITGNPLQAGFSAGQYDPTRSKIYLPGTDLKYDNGQWGDHPYSAGDSSSGSGAFSFPGWNDTFSYAPWDKTFQAPDGITEQNDPGYKDRMALGADAIQRSALAQGTGLTGGTLKDLEQFGQTFGSTEYGNVYGRALNDYNSALDAYKLNYNTAAQQYNQRYAQYGDNYNRAYQTYMGNFGVSNTLNQEGFANSLSLANLGLAGATGTNNAGNNLSNNATNTITGIGNTTASGQVGGANAINGGLANITNGLQPYLYGTQSSYRKAPADQQGYPGQYGGG